MFKQAIGVLSAFLLSGCLHDGSGNYMPDPGSGFTRTSMNFAYQTGPIPNPKDDTQIGSAAMGTPGFADAFNRCMTTADRDELRRELNKNKFVGAGLGAALIGAVLAPAVQYGVDRYIHSAKKKAEKIQKANTASYSGRQTLTADQLSLPTKDKPVCLIFARSSRPKAEKDAAGSLSLLLVLEMRSYKEAVALKPIYMWMDNATSQTRKADKPGTAKVSVSAALSLTTTVKNNQFDHPEIKALEGPSFTFSGVPVGGQGTADIYCSDVAKKDAKGKPKNCPVESDLFLLPTDRSTSLSLAIVETGSESKLTDRIASELEARKTALGTALGSVVGLVQPATK